jgi:hypothetical protein
MEKLEAKEIVDVQIEDGKKVSFVLLDEDRGEIREVYWNRQKFDSQIKKFVDDPKKSAEVDAWCEEFFGLPFNRLGETIGEKMDIWCYPKFNSFWEVPQIAKFEDDMEGQIINTVCKNAFDDGKKISIQFEYDGELYESKMQYADYLEARNEWFINPTKREKQYTKFEEKFQMPVDEIENMIGKDLIVEVKKAMGKYIYNEVKPFPKPKSEKKPKTKSKAK